MSGYHTISDKIGSKMFVVAVFDALKKDEAWLE